MIIFAEGGWIESRVLTQYEAFLDDLDGLMGRFL